MLTKGQKLAIEQLQRVENADNYLFEIKEIKEPREDSPGLLVYFSLYCGTLPRVPEGLPLRERENFVVSIDPDFPFIKPEVWAGHNRFAGFPHVQWKKYLCLYQAPQTEWDPNDGMFGFMERLNNWLKQGALNQLDPIGAALHPPVTYRSGPFRIVIPKINAPSVREENWFGYAHLNICGESRVDIIGWSKIDTLDLPKSISPAILLCKPLPWEMPDKMADLIKELDAHCVPRNLLLPLLGLAALNNEKDAPLYVIIGTPMRGISGSTSLIQHIMAFYIEPVFAKVLRLALEKYSDREEIRKIGKEVEDIIINWTEKTNLEWCTILESRPEVITQRDYSSPMCVFKGLTVSLWGCGALGSFVANLLAQAGVKKLMLKDNGIVKPGILCRQLYDESDIGQEKSIALKKRLLRMRPDIEIDAKSINILKILNREDFTDNADIVIDCTASNSIQSKLELVMKHSGDNHPPIISMIISSRANRGIVIISNSEYSGGITDIYWRTKIEICRKGFTAFADEFYPVGKSEFFQPEPGCSDPTFIGSGADVAGLSGIMLNLAGQQLSIGPKCSASAHLVTLPSVYSNNAKGDATFTWDQYIVCNDSINDYKIRITQEAWKQILTSIRKSIRENGPEVETGGLLFGKRDDVSKIIWVSDAVGPPPDSIATKHGFICGIKGTAEAHDVRVKQTRGAVAYIGVWHTHPKSLPLPSEVDFVGMEQILTKGELPPLKNLLLIVSMSSLEAAEALLGAFVFDKSVFTNAYMKGGIPRKVSPGKSSIKNTVKLILKYFGIRQSK